MENLEDRVALDKLEILNDMEETQSYKKWGHSSLLEYLVTEIGFTRPLAEEQMEELSLYRKRHKLN